MAMTAGASSGGVQSDINVTPMIDVLLVLLIIFMITQPLSRMAMDVQVPPPDENILPSELKFDIYAYICGLNNMVAGVREKLSSSKMPV